MAAAALLAARAAIDCFLDQRHGELQVSAFAFARNAGGAARDRGRGGAQVIPDGKIGRGDFNGVA